MKLSLLRTNTRASCPIAEFMPKARTLTIRVWLVFCALLFVLAWNSAQAKEPTPSDGTRISLKSHPQKKICQEVHNALIKQRYQDQSLLFVESVDAGGRDSIYQGIDLDKDGKHEKILQSCGSPMDGTCTLYVGLSNGGGYEMSEELFKVIRFRKKYYVVVGDSYPRTSSRRRLYLLTARGAELNCASF